MQRISKSMDARLERWAYHLYRQGNVATAPFRRAGLPTPTSRDGGGQPLADSEFAETQSMIGRLPNEDRFLVVVWYTAGDRREIPAWFSAPGQRGPQCRLTWPWPRTGSAGVPVRATCRCDGCIDRPSFSTLYRRLAHVHRALWAMLDERRRGGVGHPSSPAVRVPGTEANGLGRTIAHVAPIPVAASEVKAKC
jgi:hypothetical protein